MYNRFKFLLYSLRVLRELEPAILVGLSLYSYTDNLWAARAGASATAYAMLPMRSRALDKSAWHFAITQGETNPATGTPWWQDVDALDVYPNSVLQQNMTVWPAPLKDWQSSATDDLWCISYSGASSTHVPYGPVRAPNGQCGQLPPQVSAWCSGWNTSVHVGDGASFPNGDPGWRCILPPPENWPPTAEGRCYTFCLDISGEANHAPPHTNPDLFLVFALPIMFDLFFILTWIHHKALFAGFHGRLSLKVKLAFFCASAGCVTVATLLAIRIPTDQGVYSQHDYPGAISWVCVTYFWGIYFLNLALEDDCPYVRRFMAPWIRAQMTMVGVKTTGESGCKHPIDSDTALCFFLAQGYKSSFNSIKRLALACFILLIFCILTFAEAPGSWVDEYAKYNSAFYSPGTFLSSQIVVILLLVTKIWQVRCGRCNTTAVQCNAVQCGQSTFVARCLAGSRASAAPACVHAASILHVHRPMPSHAHARLHGVSACADCVCHRRPAYARRTSRLPPSRSTTRCAARRAPSTQSPPSRASWATCSAPPAWWSRRRRATSLTTSLSRASRRARGYSLRPAVLGPPSLPSRSRRSSSLEFRMARLGWEGSSRRRRRRRAFDADDARNVIAFGRQATTLQDVA